MQGKHTHQPKLITSVTLDSLVPTDNFYRRVSALLNLCFLYRETESFYGREGKASIDPVVFFKLLLVGYLNNLNSDRKLVQFASNLNKLLKWNRKTAIGKVLELRKPDIRQNRVLIDFFWSVRLVDNAQTFVERENQKLKITTL